MLTEIPFEDLTVEALKGIQGIGARTLMDGDARVVRITAKHLKPSMWLSYLENRRGHITTLRDVLPAGTGRGSRQS